MVAVVALMAGAYPRNGAGQMVTGRLSDEGASATVAGALVVLEDESGAERMFGLADERGRFMVRAGAPGRFRLRVDRVGFESVWSPPLDLGAGEVREFQITLPMAAVSLEGLGGAAHTACSAETRPGPHTMMAWAEARKALISAWLVDDARLYRYQVGEYENEVLDSTQARSHTTAARWVDVHPLGDPGERWVHEGFVRTSAGRAVFQAPVPTILIAQTFTDRHCLDAVVGDSVTIGLAFAPRDTLLPDVSGTIWMDVETAQIRSVDYEFVNLAKGVESSAPRGHLELDRLEDGAWFIGLWTLSVTEESGDSSVVVESGGEVLATAPVFTDVGPSETQIAGVVHDSIHGGPLTGASVFLWGTDHQTLTDGLGRFAFSRDVPPGDYSISFYHRSASDWGIIPPQVPVSAEYGQESWVLVALPSVSTLVAAQCEEEEGGVVVGSVRDASTGLPLPRASIVLDWTESNKGNYKPGRMVGRADGRGWYYFCDIPIDLPIIARAQFNDEWTSGNTFIAAPDVASVVHVAVPVMSTVMATGRVVDGDSGEPIVGASVGLVGLQERHLSDSTGAFSFGAVAPGFYEISIVHRDYGAVSDTVTIRDTGGGILEVRLASAAVERAMLVSSVGGNPDFVLEPIIVEGKPVPPSMAPFYRRRAGGFGGFVTREEFERFTPSEVTDVIRRMPSFAVVPNPTYEQTLANGMIDLRRWRVEVTTRGSRRGMECPPLVYLDQLFIGNAQEADVNMLSVDAIEAIEAYGMIGSIPAEFNRQGAACGVIVLWTRR